MIAKCNKQTQQTKKTGEYRTYRKTTENYATHEWIVSSSSSCISHISFSGVTFYSHTHRRRCMYVYVENCALDYCYNCLKSELGVLYVLDKLL